MKIDFEATRLKFDAAGYSQAKVARSMENISGAVFNLVLSGSYRHMGSPRAVKIFEKLRELNVLVEVPNEDEQRAA